jgi:hypothetical protein
MPPTRTVLGRHPLARLVLVGVLALSSLGLSAAGARATATPTICPGRFGFARAGTVLAIPVCSNRPLGSIPAGTVHRVIVVIHGDSRNAADHLRYIERAAAASGVGDALILAPQFLTAADVTAAKLPATTLYWADDAWKEGLGSAVAPLARPASVNAFGAIDALVKAYTDPLRYPGITTVAVAGHSAGGQFVNRYSAMSVITATLATRHIATRFVVANPSSYLYLDGRRPDPASGAIRTLTATEQASCRRYDTYRYGLVGDNPYGGLIPAATVRSRFAGHDVTYLLGSLDTDPADPTLDTSCPGEWQGPQRYARGIHYRSSLGMVFGAGIDVHHRFQTVPGVAHDASAMYGSALGRAALFG